jgi:dihydrodipicolinate synthase/N-acetylneuraminate lyase
MRDGAGSSLASGVFAALLTPRQPDSTEADAGRLLEYLDRVSRAGVNGLVFFGATGEFVHFDLDERVRVVSLAAKRSRIPVLVNVSHSTLAGSIYLAEQSAAAGAAGLLLMPPYFYKLEEDAIAEFYSQFVKAVGKSVPIYLYNLPQSTALISPDLAFRLLSSGLFAGIKNSGADWPFFESLFKLREQFPFRLLVGNESVYLRALTAGANGAISGVASALPELPVAIHRAVTSGDMQTASALSEELDTLLSWIERFPPIVALKQIAHTRRWLPFTPALPIDSTSQAGLCDFAKWLEQWLPATLSACSSRPSVRS